MEKVVGEQDLALQQHFPYKSSILRKFKLSYKLALKSAPNPKIFFSLK